MELRNSCLKVGFNHNTQRVEELRGFRSLFYVLKQQMLGKDLFCAEVCIVGFLGIAASRRSIIWKGTEQIKNSLVWFKRVCQTKSG